MVHNGGIKAVAIATPGTMVIAALLLLDAEAIIPAKPPKKAMLTSNA